MKRRYFDWAATAPPMPPALPAGNVPFGNPSSRHTEGRLAREALEEARRRCAGALGVQPETLCFTSGGTESNVLALHSLLLKKGRAAGFPLLYSAVEHPSVRENAFRLERLGLPSGEIAVEADGRVSERTLAAALAKHGKPRLAALMAVNNETGAVMDLPRLVPLLRGADGPPAHIHSDLVQAAGKIPLDLRAWDLDSASLSAHKLRGPRGTGLLYLRKPLEPLAAGGGQEGGLRPGTETVAGALALADCLEAFLPQAEAEYRLAAARAKALIAALKGMERCVIIPACREAEDSRFSPYILQAAFRGIPGEVMVRALDDAGFAVSTGSACGSQRKQRPVLAAMGLDQGLSFEGIRISQGWTVTMDDIAALIEAIRGIAGVL